MTISVRSPTDIGSKNVFVLNDIDFNIPPTQIEIRNENLMYQYKTLRTKSSTKVPTGHGQAVINLRIPFTPATLLDLHRLITQFRFSPFFYLDNRYVRETLVPAWPWTQNIAVTATGLNISSMPGSSDTLVAELDLLWFNYFPFMHNYYFREEWQTNWIRSKDDPSKSVTTSIGWSLDKDYKKDHHGSVIQSRNFEDAKSKLIYPGATLLTNQSVETKPVNWDISQGDFKSSTNRTIFEMEAAHPGTEFDLLPIPGNMQPANIVTQPKYSHIFVRFMNLLQRDALYKNFGIEVDRDLLDYEKTHNLEGKLWNRFFTIGSDRDGNPIVEGLHTIAVPSVLRNKWISQMRQHNHGIKFMYNEFKEIRLPQKFVEATQNKRNSAVATLAERVGYAGDFEAKRYLPTGEDDPAMTVLLGEPRRITSEYGKLRKVDEGQEKAIPHGGLDIASPIGSPLYAPMGGTVADVKSSASGSGGRQIKFKGQDGSYWWFCHLDSIQNDIGKNTSVEAGRLLGYTGMTGHVTGPHLHVEYVGPNTSGKSDPYPAIKRIYESTQYNVSEQSEDIFEYLPTVNQQTTTAEDYLENAKYQAQTALKATDEEAEALLELFQLLDAEGWTYYDKDSSITNIWKKMIILDINHSGLDRVTGIAEDPEAFRHAGIICTNIAGGINHIVSKIPVLSHEWPTHQHLGSIEPSYQLEFAVLDDQTNLEGIGSMGQLVQGMRSVLQSNSRKFRAILDGHCIATDTFITRLLGSYENNDLKILEIGDQIADAELKKKTVISNSYAGTVEGNPGLSVINYSIQETNPYDFEGIVAHAPALQDKEESRKQVLTSTFDLKVLDSYKPLMAALFIASKIDRNITDPNSDVFGKLVLRKSPYDNISIPYIYTGDVYGGQLSDGAIVFPYATESELDFLNAFGIDYDNTSWGEGWASIPSTYFNEIPQQTSLTDVYQPAASNYETVYHNDTVTYNLLELARANNNSDLDFAAFQRFADYYVGIKAALDTGERLFAETEAGGLSPSFLSEFLYSLPVKNNMWKIWQIYLEEFVKANSYYADKSIKSSGLEQMHQNDSWPYEHKAQWLDNYPEEYRAELAAASKNSFIEGGWDLINVLSSPFWQLANGAGAAVSSDIDMASLERTKRDAAISRLVNHYMQTLPLQYRLSERFKVLYQTYIGSIINSTNLDSNSATAPALRSSWQSLYDNADSCGNISYYFPTDASTPVWIVTEEEMGRRGGFLGAFLDPNLTTLGFAVDNTGLTSLKNLATGGDKTAYEGWDQSISNTLKSIGVEDYLRPFQQVGPTPGSPFVYKVDESTEQQKAYYIKNLLAVFADGMLADYPVLKILGLEHLMFLETSTIKGTECYPDIELPAHPYYGDSKLVSPDFFMWNIYEDGGALSVEEQERIQTQVDAIVVNAYQSMKRLENGSSFDTNSDTVLSESGIDGFRFDTKITAEGTDGNAQNGISSSPFYPVKAAAQDTNHWINTLASSKSTVLPSAFAITNLVIAGATAANRNSLHSTKPSDFLHGIRLSNVESVFGGGATGWQYPARVSQEQYSELKKQFEATTQMFGSVEGYMNQQLSDDNVPGIEGEISGTNLERPFEIAHTFDIESLKKLSKDSAKDLLSQKMSLKRAFPTFKLFFIEEDEFETRFINFDDFYSYNAVKSFTVVLSRKIPADTAVISLQNIQGTLDGTRRNAIVDLDYFNGDTAKKKLAGNGDASLLSDEPLTVGTSSEQPFAAVVLRPGLNIQLRTGYSNDPDNLHVLISGRIVDVTWNQSGDLAEIMVQSFGTELAQVLKGTSRNSNIVTYTTTHQLLASMMLEPEITHFGRWEFGQTYFIGEAKDYKLDFVDYSRAGYLGKFTNTEGITKWIIDHPKTIFAAGVAVTAASFLPWGAIGKVFGKSKIGASLFGKASVAYWETGYRAVVAEAGGGAAGTRALAGAVDNSLTALGARALKGAGNAPEMAALIGARVSADKALIVGHLLAEQTDDAIRVAANSERYLQGLAFKGRWMTKPWAELGSAGFLSAVGTKPLKTAATILLDTPLKLTALGLAAGATLDIGAMISDWYGTGKIRKWVKNFFGRKQATLFLTPQDDNLFPPHPKDYMTLDEGFIETAFKFTTRSIGALIGDPGIFDGIYRLAYPDSIMSKKAAPAAFSYQPVSSTIWDIFEEMSIRHPGWIYGARPYGNAFRYTMFFGLPAQRYWSKPATNGFIYRANQLKRTLDSSDNLMISEAQFEQLYGKQLLDEVLFKVDSNPIVNEYGEPGETEFERKIRVEQLLGSYAIKEYLRALETRFEPFRRYHLLTSDKDIVWNGIMGTENAVSNAVDVTYFSEEKVDDVYDLANNVQSAVFKAHAFIPENQLRIAPVRWPNCKGYTMAMRYGMGELLTRIKDMYRGELIVVGNARIRPWDVAILVDTYNDMVGPVEVEQVVHTFSHETGFITEIKPSAVAFANEISGWPMIEGMKLFAMAIHDIHNRYHGLSVSNADIGAGDPGLLDTVAGLVTKSTSYAISGNNTPTDRHSKLDSFMKEKYSRIFGTTGATTKDVFGDNAPPNLDFLDRGIQDVLQDISIGVGIAGSVSSLGGTIVGLRTLNDSVKAATNAEGLLNTIKAVKALPKGTVGKAFVKSPYGLAAVATVIAGSAFAAAGFGSAVAINQMDFPSIGWLMGSSVLFLQCLRTDAIIVTPLIKGGTPIVAGLATSDPAMIWKTFRGKIERTAQETLKGTSDMLSLYSRYGSALWEEATNDGIWSGFGAEPYNGELTNERTGIINP